MQQVQNSAQMVVFMAQDNHADVQLIATGVDAECRHFYGQSSTLRGAYVGTRFTDGSAVSASGHTGAPVEFLGMFAAEQEAEA